MKKTIEGIVVVALIMYYAPGIAFIEIIKAFTENRLEETILYIGLVFPIFILTYMYLPYGLLCILIYVVGGFITEGIAERHFEVKE